MDPTRRRAPAAWAVSIAATSLLALAIAPRAAQAQSAEAEQRFNEAEALLAAGKVAEACDAFEESNRLEPRAGTLINIGLCKEKLGKLASALAAYRGALERVKDPKKKAIATERVAALEPRVSQLTVAVAPKARADGLVVSLDGRTLDDADRDRAIPVDGGRHEIAASAPGHRRWSKTVEVEPEGDKATVRVPALAADEPSSPAKAAPAEPGEPGDRPAAKPRGGPSGSRTIKIVGFGLLGVSVASMTYVFFTTVSGPIPDYEALGVRPRDNTGTEREATASDCDSALGKELRDGVFASMEGNQAFDKACTTSKRRLIAGVVGLASGVIGATVLYLAYRSDAAAATRQAAIGRRGRRQLVVAPVIGPGIGGASLRFAW